MQRITKYFVLAAATLSLLAVASPSWAQSDSCPCFNASQIVGTCSNPNTSNCVKANYITCTSTNPSGGTLTFKYYVYPDSTGSTPTCSSMLSTTSGSSETTQTLRSSDEYSAIDACQTALNTAKPNLPSGSGVTESCGAQPK